MTFLLELFGLFNLRAFFIATSHSAKHGFSINLENDTLILCLLNLLIIPITFTEVIPNSIKLS